MSDSTITPPKPRCLYCGNNPVNHTAAYISQSITVAASPLSQKIDLLAHPKVFSVLHSGVSLWMWLLEKLHLIRFSKDRSRVASDRSMVIWEEAERRGIPMEQMIISGKAVEQYRAHTHGKWCYFGSLPIPLDADRSAYSWMDSKVRLKQFLHERGVRVPYGGRATSLKEAEAIFEKAIKPLIAKPEVGSRGRHTATHLHTREDLRHGFKIAQKLSHFVVVEEHLVGSVYRATYVGGEIVGILRGDPPRITGDGILSIDELIEKKNSEKPERVKDFRITDLTHEFLARQGYTLASILETGKTIDIHEKIGLSYGGDALEEITITHPELLVELKKAGDVLGAPIVGFDFISEDITKHPSEVRWGIIEANSMPFIDLHHFPRVGEPINVAAKVWDLWER